MPYYALDYLPYQYLRKARRGRSGRSAVLGQAVKSAGIRNGNVASFSKIRHCDTVDFKLDYEVFAITMHKLFLKKFLYIL